MTQQPKLNSAFVTFDEKAHRYFLADGTEVRGVTPIVGWVFPQTYAGVPQDILNRAAEYGSKVHQGIELIDIVGACEEYPCNRQFLDMMKDSGMHVIAHEYIVSDQQHIASAIDVVLQDEAGNIWLADVKTTSSLHESNIRCQLSIYKYLFEQQNPHLKVAGAAAIWLPKPQYGKPAFKALPITSSDIAKETITAYLAGGDGAEFAKYYTDEVNGLPAQYADVISAIADCEWIAKEMADRSKAMKEKLLDAFRENGVKKFENDQMVITYIAPTTRSGIDSKKLKEKHADAYEDCQKVSKVSDSIKITLR